MHERALDTQLDKRWNCNHITRAYPYQSCRCKDIIVPYRTLSPARVRLVKMERVGKETGKKKGYNMNNDTA